MKKNKHLEPTGNCYEANALMLLELVKSKGDAKRFTLVHGQVYHPLSNWHGHCWIETEDKILDFSNGHNISMDKKEYYKKGRIKDTKKYTFKQMARNLLKTEHYGDWKPEEDMFYDR